MRSGVLAKKLGMTRIFDAEGRHVPVTVLLAEPCVVIRTKTRETDGYDAVQLGAGARKPSALTQAVRGHFAKFATEPRARVQEFRVSPEFLVEPGQQIGADHFAEGQAVDVRARSIGKGFAGSMKRHNFHGLRATHGVSVSHRSHGSTGQRQDPGRVFKGKKMAGHMGDRMVSVQNLRVARIDAARRLILVEGAVPGPKGGWVTVRDAIKKPRKEATEA